MRHKIYHETLETNMECTEKHRNCKCKASPFNYNCMWVQHKRQSFCSTFYRRVSNQREMIYSNSSFLWNWTIEISYETALVTIGIWLVGWLGCSIQKVCIFPIKYETIDFPKTHPIKIDSTLWLVTLSTYILWQIHTMEIIGYIKMFR